MRGIPRSPENSPDKGQWRGALMFSLIFARINDGVNTRLFWRFETPSRPLWRHCNDNSIVSFLAFRIPSTPAHNVNKVIYTMPGMSLLLPLHLLLDLNDLIPFSQILCWISLLIYAPTSITLSYTPLKLRHEWIITYHCAIWIYIYLRPKLSFADSQL